MSTYALVKLIMEFHEVAPQCDTGYKYKDLYYALMKLINNLPFNDRTNGERDEGAERILEKLAFFCRASQLVQHGSSKGL